MDYLIEIGTEELPAGTTGEIANNFQTLFVNKLSEFGLLTQSTKQDSINIQLFSTPRRIALLVSGLPAQTEAKEELVKGPAPTAPAQAIEGFAKKNQIAQEELEVIEGRLCFKKRIQPIKIQTVLQQSLEYATSSLSGEKWMTWADGEFNFSRPVRWLVSLLDSEIFPIKLFGLTADRKTRVNRLLEAESQNNVKFVEIDSAQNYVQILRSDKCLVEPLREERKKRILQQIDEIKKEEKFNVGVKDELVEEVIDLLEWPTALVGEFEKGFLKLPAFLIKTVLSHHQRYFYCFKQDLDDGSYTLLYDGENFQLLNQFIFIAQCKAEAQETVIKGNERVLRARLKDAEFFVQEDLKVPLMERKEKLKKMTFQKELGEGRSTMFDKVERLIKIADESYSSMNIREDCLSIFKNTCELSKCDLASNLVFEFPELQGLAGGYIHSVQEYKRNWGDSKEGDPESYTLGIPFSLAKQYSNYEDNMAEGQFGFGVAFAIIDRVDNLVALFSIGKFPTGSSDPFALRRQAMDIFRMLLNESLWPTNIHIWSLFHAGYKALNLTNEGFEAFFTTSEKGVCLAEFLRQRLIFVLSEKFPKELVEACIVDINIFRSVKIQSVNKLILALNEKIENKNLYATFASIRRVYRILKNFQLKRSLPIKSYLFVGCEFKLSEAVERWWQIVSNKEVDFSQCLQSLTELQKPIDEFFEGVMVEDPNPEIAHNRKALLYSLKQKLDDVFFAPDWDKLVQYMEEKTKS
ncbi:MAG: glycine--tRNA ligase subunit beta [Candidatus Melainabacteria bacterium]